MADERWERLGIYDEPRLSELIQLYEEIGLKVRTEPVEPLAEPGCTECIKTAPECFRVLYTCKRNDR